MLKEGMVITIEPLHNPDQEKYKGRVMEVESEQVYIDYPINMVTDRPVFLLTGSKLKVSFTLNEQAAYYFETEITGRRSGNIPMLSITYPGDKELVKIQRRQYVRVSTSVDAALELEGDVYKTVTSDVSAGGVSFIINKPLAIDKGQNVVTTLVLPMKKGGTQYIQAEGIFIRQWDRKGIQIGSLRFDHLTGQERQLLLRFTFERQLTSKQKGLPVS